MKERDKGELPQIIDDLNTNLKPSEMTIESIAEKVGISRTTLYRWVRKDREFLEALQIIKEVQDDDPFKTGTEEDSNVSAAIITHLLLETRDRHYKPHNQ
jgi:transposase-like protein